MRSQCFHVNRSIDKLIYSMESRWVKIYYIRIPYLHTWSLDILQTLSSQRMDTNSKSRWASVSSLSRPTFCCGTSGTGKRSALGMIDKLCVDEARRRGSSTISCSSQPLTAKIFPRQIIQFCERRDSANTKVTRNRPRMLFFHICRQIVLLWGINTVFDWYWMQSNRLGR